MGRLRYCKAGTYDWREGMDLSDPYWDRMNLSNSNLMFLVVR